MLQAVQQVLTLYMQECPLVNYPMLQTQIRTVRIYRKHSFSVSFYLGQHLLTLLEPNILFSSGANTEQWPLSTKMRAVYRYDLLTISLYASLLSLGVSLIVPINTKNKPRANERATIVIVLGEAILRHRACSSFPLN